jgi:hypothetical protein
LTFNLPLQEQNQLPTFTQSAFGEQPPIPPTIPVHEKPPIQNNYFRFAPGTTPSQIQSTSLAIRRIIAYAPGLGSLAPNTNSIFFGGTGLSVAGITSTELPPGASVGIQTNDVIAVYWIAQNATDLITGWLEQDWPGNY